MKFVNVYTIASTLLFVLSFILFGIGNSLSLICISVAGGSLVSSFYSIKETISWNNGICKETGQPWVQIPEFPDRGKSFESKGENGTFYTNLQFCQPKYNFLFA